MTEPSFLQSAGWARFQGALGHAVFEVEDVRFFGNSLPLGGSYLYCPHPDIADSAAFLASATKLAGQEHAWFVRVEPNAGSSKFEAGGLNRPTIYDLRSTLPVQPANTWHVSLGPDEQMLAAMHEKTRYNIRVAEKRGVTVRFSSDPADASLLYELLAKTGERAGIRLHEARYYTKMIEILGSTTKLRVEVVIAEAEGTSAAAALIAHFGHRAIYLHGGSDYEQRNLMAPHLLHWSAMQRARDLGATVYDMGGIAPDDQPNHPWTGITRFKQAFGGKAIHYPPAVDLVVNNGMYSLYQFGRSLNRSLHAL